MQIQNEYTLNQTITKFVFLYGNPKNNLDKKHNRSCRLKLYGYDSEKFSFKYDKVIGEAKERTNMQTDGRTKGQTDSSSNFPSLYTIRFWLKVYNKSCNLLCNDISEWRIKLWNTEEVAVFKKIKKNGLFIAKSKSQLRKLYGRYHQYVWYLASFPLW